MRKILGSAILLALLSCPTQAQIRKGAYTSLSLGYQSGITTNNNIYYGEFLLFANTFETPTTNTIETVKLSLGKGVNFGGNFGYMFTKNLGAEIGLHYLSGAKTSANQYFESATGWENNSISLKSNQLQIQPSLVIAAGYDKINPYAKLGLALGFHKTFFNSYQTDYTGNAADYEITMTGGTMVGLRASAGINYAINAKFSVFAELTSIQGNIKPKEGKVTKATFNGIDQLSSLNYNDSHIVFVEQYNSDIPEADTEPSKNIRPSFSATSLGLNFGVTYHF